MTRTNTIKTLRITIDIKTRERLRLDQEIKDLKAIVEKLEAISDNQTELF